MNLRAIEKILLRWIKRPAAVGAKLAKKIDWHKAQPGRITVLCLERSQFIKDIAELRRLTDVNWATLSAVKVKRAQEDWVPAADRQQGFFSTWLRQDRCRHLRPTLERFGVALLKEAGRTQPIDAVLAANMDYWQDEALKLGCRKLGIPFLVLYRENYTIPWTGPWLHDYIKRVDFRFEGDAIAVFSQATKDAAVPAVTDPDNIWITGAPRYDRWVDHKPAANQPRDHIALITFNDAGYEATSTFMEVMRIVDKVARAAQVPEQAGPDLAWLVKCKKRADREIILERMGSNEDSPLNFQYDVPLYHLYPRSRVIVGYNSLAMVEALLTDTPILVPCWGETRPAATQLLLDFNDPLVRRVINFADTPEQFRDLLARVAAGETLPVGNAADRKEVFSRHLRLPGGEDGTVPASFTTVAFIQHYINQAKAQRAAAGMKA